MAYRYDRPTEGYTQKIPPGVQALRSEIARMFGLTRTEVIRNLSRCQQQSSEHCVCRGIDFFTTNLVLGRRIFDLLVRHADALGVQSVIFNNRQWGFGLWYERGDPSSPHLDHVHVGLNRWAAANLTVAMIRSVLGGTDIGDDDMTPEQERLLTNIGNALGVGPNDAESDSRMWWADLHREVVSRSEQPQHKNGIGKDIKAILDTASSGGVDVDAFATKVAQKLGPTIAGLVADELARRLDG